MCASVGSDIFCLSQIPLETKIADGGRGAELSELVVFDGRLLTVDDRSGIG